MRKRLIITNLLMVFFSLLCLLLISVAIIVGANKKQAKSELSTYLNLAANIYNGTNEEEVVNIFKEASEKTRITIISLDGEVLADTYENEFDSHLDREEISELGTFVERFSKTLNVSMMYVAIKDDGNYLRISISLDDINPILDTYTSISIVALLLIVLMSTLLMWPINRKELEPLVFVTNKLNRITGQPCNDTFGSIEEISSEIDNISQIINRQMLEINYAKNQIECIINNLNQGLLVIDENKQVSLINDYAKRIFNMKPEYINSNYIYTIRNMELQKGIEKAFVDGEEKIDLSLDGKIYHITFNKTDEKVIVIMYDITLEKITNDMKREFFQNASHELKSPLTSILGYQQMIDDGILVDEKDVKGAIEKTIKEAQRMKKIIIEMLELSKLESKIDFSMNEIDVANVIKEVLHLFETKIVEKNIGIENKAKSMVINANDEHIFILVKNLIENAIKYNKENGGITIECSDDILKITDTGIGISEKHIQHIFERFYRVDKAKSKEAGGTGLGLAIVKHVCNIYNYELLVESTLNVGTSFIITFKKQ